MALSHYERQKKYMATEKGKATRVKYMSAHKKSYKYHYEGYTEGKKKWKRENKLKANKWNLFNKYKITLEQWEQMRVSQGNKCAVCEKEFIKTPHVDHNHETGCVRQLLCANCNILLGLSHDNVVILEKAIAYLKKWS